MELGLADVGITIEEGLEMAFTHARYQQDHDYAMSLVPQMCPFCMNPYPALVIAAGESRVECRSCGAHSDGLPGPPDHLIAVDHIVGLLQRWNVLSEAARGLSETSWVPPESGWVNTPSGWAKHSIPVSSICAGPRRGLPRINYENP